MRKLTVCIAALSISLLLVVPAYAACPPEGQTLESLQTLKTSKFSIDDTDGHKALATGLIECLGDPNPVLRDDIASGALSTWMRAGSFDGDTLRGFMDTLYAQLDGDDADGFRKPYSALVLSEVARTDRIKPWMTDEERAAMVEKASAYLESITDYRTFTDKEGWRNSVSYGSDWLLQLALNPALTKEQANRMLAAIASQVVPDAAPAYVSGESGHLARPITALAQHGFYSERDWNAWFASLPPKIGDAALAYNDNKWIARRHDLMAFLLSLYIEADQSTDANIHFLKPAIVTAVKSVP